MDKDAKLQAIYERAMELSAKAEEMAVSTEDIVSSVRCLGVAIRAVRAAR